MPLINPPVPSDGEDADAADIAIPINLIAALLNGNLDGDNISASTALIITSLITSGNIEGNNIAANGDIDSDGDVKIRNTSLESIRNETMFDHVASGCVLSRTSGLGWSLTAGVVYINGRRYTVAATTGSVTASKDTYFDVTSTGSSGGVAPLVNTGGNILNNNSASPALAANSIRIGIVVSGASIAADTSINQGQENRVLPTVSSIPYAVTDSLGNLICPRDPNRKLLGYRQSIANQGGIGAADLTGLSMIINVPTGGRKIKISAQVDVFQNTTNNYGELTIMEGATSIKKANAAISVTTQLATMSPFVIITPSAGVHTYKLNLAFFGGLGQTLGSAANPQFISAELV